MNWALVGIGNIAEAFMESIKHVENANVIAAYGRNQEKLNSFCDKWDIPNRYTDYNQLYERLDIEIVYIATTHIVHHEHTLAALQHGKHVLCEKPMAMSYKETQSLINAAREQQVFLMEAMWTRFFPATVWLQEFIASKEFGEPLNVNAEFSFECPYDPNYRMFNKELGGGSMRSAGIYPLAYACMVFKSIPTKVEAFSEIRNGVDLRTAAIIQFEGERQTTAQLYTGFQGQSRSIANIAFEKGNVVVFDFIHPNKIEIQSCKDKKPKAIEFPYLGNGLQFEIEHVMECIIQGKIESSVMPLEETLELARITDLIYSKVLN